MKNIKIRYAMTSITVIALLFSCEKHYRHQQHLKKKYADDLNFYTYQLNRKQSEIATTKQLIASYERIAKWTFIDNDKKIEYREKCSLSSKKLVMFDEQIKHYKKMIKKYKDAIETLPYHVDPDPIDPDEL